MSAEPVPVLTEEEALSLARRSLHTYVGIVRPLFEEQARTAPPSRAAWERQCTSQFVLSSTALKALFRAFDRYAP